MQEIFAGYVRLNGKRCAQKLKGGDYLTLGDAKKCEGYGGVLAPTTILVDVDDEESAEVVLKTVEAEEISCVKVKTTRGMHFYFVGYPRGMKCRTHCRLALGVEADIKVGSRLSYGVLKCDGVEREIVEPDGPIGELPDFLRPVSWSPEFRDMETGDGRNQSLFNYILTLQAEGFTREETRHVLDVINRNVLGEALTEEELTVIYRDEAFSEELFYDSKGHFLFNKFAESMRAEHHVIKISGQLHMYHDGIYVPGTKYLESAMIQRLPMLSQAKRREVISYLDVLITDDTLPTDADKIAFANGVYDLSNDEFRQSNSDDIITNRIPWDYDPEAYSELADNVLWRLSCEMEPTRLLLEEIIGYTFYRRNELRKCFILLGDRSNGKSTYLSLLTTLLGPSNVTALDMRELGERFKTAELFGKLANIGDDIDDSFIESSAVFKKLVSGDPVMAERKGLDPFNFASYAKLLFSANVLPRMRDKTGAALSRMVIVPFDAVFDKSDPNYDPYIKYKLRTPEVMSYLINLGLDGLKRVLHERAFTVPQNAEKAYQEYVMDNNPIYQYFATCEQGDFAGKIVAEAYQDYVGFSLRSGYKAVAQSEFTKHVNKTFDLVSVTKRIDKKRIRVFDVQKD